MSKWIISMLTALSLGSGIASVASQEPEAEAPPPPPPPCTTEAHHSDFDFWVGEWNVFIADGRQVGGNVITKIESDCLLVEKWLSVRGNTGTSINYFDPMAQQWVQVWMSADRTLIDIRGGMKDGSMRLEGTIVDSANPGGASFRGTWTLLEDGRVRQFFEISPDQGATWTPWFEGFYVKVGQETS